MTFEQGPGIVIVLQILQIRLRSCPPSAWSFCCSSLLYVILGKRRQEEDAIRPGARRLEGVRTHSWAWMSQGPRTAPRRRPLPASPQPGRSVRAPAPSTPFTTRRRALAPAGGHSGCVACEFPGVHAGPTVGMATGQPVPEPPARSAHAAATAGAGAGAAPMMHRVSPVPSGPPCCRSER